MTESTYAGQSYNPHSFRKGIVLTLLLVLLFLIVFGVGVSQLLHNGVPTRASDNEANQGTTQNTNAPTKDTGTPRDRSQPSPSGGEANTLLRP